MLRGLVGAGVGAKSACANAGPALCSRALSTAAARRAAHAASTSGRECAATSQLARTLLRRQRCASLCVHAIPRAPPPRSPSRRACSPSAARRRLPSARGAPARRAASLPKLLRRVQRTLRKRRRASAHSSGSAATYAPRKRTFVDAPPASQGRLTHARRMKHTNARAAAAVGTNIIEASVDAGLAAPTWHLRPRWTPVVRPRAAAAAPRPRPHPSLPDRAPRSRPPPPPPLAALAVEERCLRASRNLGAAAATLRR
jgi:hypothetical protein